MIPKRQKHNLFEQALSALAPAERLLEAAGHPDALAAGFFIQYGAAYVSW